ncbi:hypothetical protein SAMN05216419_10509 [Nitrosomonas cryotolerans]|uniref:Uncharacterized protein n=1 Tax=Nitrosomonas cryotolerans ATCC 49181 TaxID=1131553 RepID=A0A1N6GC84_9PROT|nr:hypothetical protein [Nitrosomonas cryotolerans]SFQ04416.1 hypothetical protein SAMN05216419_10509 [Nitrosomonas cryotolerans]SIO05125.1 hypothetical protein SAMN02743940_0644 [Nitrosomonas cryotolerans ATCC 49181]
MIQVKGTAMIAFVISMVFLVASTSAIAEYSQTQNKINDRQDADKQSQSNTDSKKKSNEDKSEKSFSDQSDRNINKPAGMERDTPSGAEKKGNY